MNLSDKERWFRGYLPHLHESGRTQFITWRLADSLPQELYLDILRRYPEDSDKPARFKEFETKLDSGIGSCILANPLAGRVVCEEILSLYPETATIHAFVVMPNHVHILATPNATTPLSEMMKKVKGRSSISVNRAMGRKGTLWQQDYLDRMIRNSEHFEKTAAYIEWNPVKAGLCIEQKQFPFSSANSYYANLLAVQMQAR